MGKFDSLTILKKKSARVAHVCSKCGAGISPGESYGKEHIQDSFLHSLRAKRFCAQCYEKHGDALLRKT
jgi:protein-arginine kinase activator protein McsA